MRTLLIAAIVVCGTAARAEIVDRIAVTVGDTVITASEIEKQIRLTAFLNGESPDLSSEPKRRAADRLVEQELIRREMTVSPGLAPPEAPAVDPQVEQLLKARYPSDAEYKAALERYSLTDQDVRRQLAWQTALIRFIDLRFRPGLQLPDAEVLDYYENIYLPQWRERHTGSPPSFEESREAVEQLLLGERANNALDRWLGQMRTQFRIRYREEALK